jgi:hypothetical protein
MTTRRHTIRFAAVGLAMSGLMALAACGSDDSGDDDDSTTTEATVEAGSDDTATDDTATETTDEDGSDTTFDTSDIEALSAEECQELYQKFLDLGFDPTSDEEPENADEAFEAIEDAVPDEVQDDVRVLREGFEQLEEINAEFENDVTNPEYIEALQEIYTPEYEEAAARIGAFFENCEEAVAD